VDTSLAPVYFGLVYVFFHKGCYGKGRNEF